MGVLVNKCLRSKNIVCSCFYSVLFCDSMWPRLAEPTCRPGTPLQHHPGVTPHAGADKLGLCLLGMNLGPFSPLGRHGRSPSAGRPPRPPEAARARGSCPRGSRPVQAAPGPPCTRVSAAAPRASAGHVTAIASVLCPESRKAAEHPPPGTTASSRRTRRCWRRRAALRHGREAARGALCPCAPARPCPAPPPHCPVPAGSCTSPRASLAPTRSLPPTGAL